MRRINIIILGMVLMLLIGATSGQMVNAGMPTAGVNQKVGQNASQSFYSPALNNSAFSQKIAQNANQDSQRMQGNAGDITNVSAASGTVGSSTNAAGTTPAGAAKNLTNTGTAGNASQQPPQISIYCADTGCSEQKVNFGAGTLARGCYRSQSDCMKALSQQNTSHQKPGNNTGNPGTPGTYYPGPYYYYPGPYYPGMYYPIVYYPVTYYPIAATTGTSYSSTSSLNAAETTGTAYRTGNATGTGTSGNITQSIVVADQAVTGNSILVASVTSDAPGWVVIHNNLNGAPGGIIGFAPVSAGTSTNVSVPIDPKLATTALFAELHMDLGKQGSFEYPGPDVPVIGPNGMPVMAAFRVNLPGQTAGTTGTAGYTTGQAMPTNIGMPIQPVIISYGVPSTNVGNPGVAQLGAGTTEGTPLAPYPIAMYPITTSGNTSTGTTVNSANGVTTVSSPNGVSTVSGNGAGTTTSY